MQVLLMLVQIIETFGKVSLEAIAAVIGLLYRFRKSAIDSKGFVAEANAKSFTDISKAKNATKRAEEVEDWVKTQWK
jgi:predicted nucleic-acid-binding protein